MVRDSGRNKLIKKERRREKGTEREWGLLYWNWQERSKVRLKIPECDGVDARETDK